MIAFSAVTSPIAYRFFSKEPRAFCAHQVTVEGQRLVISSNGVVVTVELTEHIAATEPSGCQVGLEDQRLVIGSAGVVVAFEFKADIAATTISVRIIRMKCNRSVVVDT